MSKNKKSWIVQMECIVTKDVVIEDCTEEEAYSNPWDYAVDETETNQVDWKVIDVTENR